MSAPAELSGRVVGDLTVQQPCGRRLCASEQRAPLQWLCLCKCGETTRRSTRSLLRAVRNGNNLNIMCGKCLDAQRISREGRRREAYMNYWLKMGSLWPDSTVIRLTESIRRVIASRYGMPDERFDGPTTVATTEVWSPPVFTRQHVNGCRDRDGTTLAAIGKVLGVSRERVRQIERDAVYKLAIGLFRVDPDLFDGRMPNHRDIADALTHREAFDRHVYMQHWHAARRLQQEGDGDHQEIEDAVALDDEQADVCEEEDEALFDAPAA